MIVYCGLRHFYIHHFSPPHPDSLYILAHNNQTWDFSPELKDLGFTNQMSLSTVHYLNKPVHIIPIQLGDFYPYTEEWLNFSLQYTNSIEVEYPHAWYLKLPNTGMCEQFFHDFAQRLQIQDMGGIWGGGPSKLVAKLAAHNLHHREKSNIVLPEQTSEFLNRIPLDRLPLPELDHLLKLGIKRIGELANLPLNELTAHFGLRSEALQKIGRGEDLIPFQARKIEEFHWEMDFTTQSDLLRPVVYEELTPYVRLGVEDLAQRLAFSKKTAQGLRIMAVPPEQEPSLMKRTLKEPTNDPRVLERAALQLIPVGTVKKITLSVTKLQPEPTVQLNIFPNRSVRNILPKQLPAQIGISIPRRERILEMWKELFL